MKTIALNVSDDIASRLEKLPKEKLEELETVISNWLEPRKRLLKTLGEMQKNAQNNDPTPEKLEKILEDKRALLEVMSDMSAYAERKGLTPEILKKK
ncbi:hypothetical protein RT717_07130 [Imperialibacter roseus]|uniref:Uncharacterized protein n=1 Tax=Imperialibacter roseus TaxID=1324217 RepID=A0ABZ0IVK5_9BACT|nr:hypothetical protein [Imperialibacter roseus]WOK08409.1 hypothetical protein RT717_07130 [Imperialibacter roseus]